MITDKSKRALWKRYAEISRYKIDGKGYLTRPEHNLLPSVRLEDFRDDLGRGSGNELYTKFRAVHSSAALAVNTFTPFKDENSRRMLSLGGRQNFSRLDFEKKLSTGLRGTPPNLDVFVETDDVVIGIESKLLEYLTPKTAKFSESYTKDRLDVEEPWWDLLDKLKNDPANKSHLDIAQLIKHYLGLRNQFSGKRQMILMYLFWEPENWQDFDVFKEHRNAIDDFKKRIQDSQVTFISQSYPDLWSEWNKLGVLPDHVVELRKRYCVELS